MKRYFKKYFLGPIILCVIILLVPLIIYGISRIDDTEISSDVLKTNQYDITYRVNEDGSCDVEEKMHIEAHCHQILKEIVYSVDKKNPISDYSDGLQTPQFDKNHFRFSLTSESGKEIFDVTGDYNIGNVYHGDLFSFSWNQGKTHEWYDEESYTLSNYSGAQAYFYLEDGLSGNYVLTYSYRICGMAMTYADIVELNWKFATHNEMKTKNVTVTIHLPNKTNANKEDVYVYGHGTKGTVDMPSASQIILHSDSLRSNEEIEARILFPKDWLNQTIIEQEKSLYHHVSSKEHLQNAIDFEKKEEQIDKTLLKVNSIVGVIDILIIGLILFFTYLLYVKFDKEYKPTFDSPYYRELPNSFEPAILGYLYHFKQVGKDDLTATLLDLIRRKYISIDSNGSLLTESKPNYMMILDKEKYENEKASLKSFEITLIEWFFTLISKDHIHLTLDELDHFNKKEKNALAYQKYNEKFIQEIENESNTYHFFENGKKARNFGSTLTIPLFLLLIAGVIGITYATFLSFFYLIAIPIAGILWISSYSTKLIRRTKEANEDYSKWKAFRKFLTDFSSMKDYPIPGIIIWEHYLVYATTLGVADLVEKQLRMKFKEAGREKELQTSTMFYYPHFGTYYCARVHASTMIATKTIAQARAERASRSSGGGRGGFGGGSSFGGGGSHMSAR